MYTHQQTWTINTNRCICKSETGAKRITPVGLQILESNMSAQDVTALRSLFWPFRARCVFGACMTHFKFTKPPINCCSRRSRCGITFLQPLQWLFRSFSHQKTMFDQDVIFLFFHFFYEGESSVIQTTVACKRMDEMSWNFIHKLVTDEPLERSVHFLVAIYWKIPGLFSPCT